MSVADSAVHIHGVRDAMDFDEGPTLATCNNFNTRFNVIDRDKDR